MAPRTRNSFEPERARTPNGLSVMSGKRFVRSSIASYTSATEFDHDNRMFLMILTSVVFVRTGSSGRKDLINRFSDCVNDSPDTSSSLRADAFAF